MLDEEVIKINLIQAYRFAGVSLDSTQCGATVIYGSYDHVGSGCNGLPQGVRVTPERLVAPLKYLYTEHAERAAILDAAYWGHTTAETTMYAPWSACADCARAIIGAGIQRLVRHKDIMLLTPERWMDTILVAETMLEEAGVEVYDYAGHLGVQILFDGELINI